MRWFLVLLLAIVPVAGCASGPRAARPNAAVPETPQSYNRMRFNEHNDLFGV